MTVTSAVGEGGVDSAGVGLRRQGTPVPERPLAEQTRASGTGGKNRRAFDRSRHVDVTMKNGSF